MQFDTKNLKRHPYIIGAALLLAAGSLAGIASAQVIHDQKPTSPIASTVEVPTGYETIYLSGMTGTLPAPAGSAPGTPGPDSGDTEAQATRALGGAIKDALASKGLGFGDIVMMHAYLAPDPATGRGDSVGWGKAYAKFFGTADQPNKPSRTSITVVLGSPTAKIEIETIAVRKPKM